MLFDNLSGTLKSSALEEALTSEVWSDRRLGVSETLHLPVRCVWMGTANNLSIAGDLPRRLVWVEIDAKMERPEERDTKKFKHPDLEQWATKNRSELLWAALVLVQAWIAKGRPLGPQVMGSYESWAKMLGGILAACGIDGFLANKDRRRRDSDDEAAQWRAVCRAWYDHHGTKDVGSKDIYEIVKANDLLPWIMAADKEQGQKQRLGHALVKVKNRCFGDFRIVAAERTTAIASDTASRCWKDGRLPCRRRPRPATRPLSSRS